jgi:ABC-type Fe3+-hydroxamate transport system substrate-binding protein
LGDVLMLGVKPLGAALTVMGRQVVYRDKLVGILDVGLVGEAETIAALRPDLILLEKTGAAAARLWSDAAPIVSFGRTEDASVRLRAIAALLGAERTAASWMARHEETANTMWASLRSRIGIGETATVLVQVGDHLFAMSNQGLAVSLYHPRGFRPSAGAAKLIGAGERFCRITDSELPSYDADRLFLLISGEGRSLSEARLLAESPAWQKLYAFRSGNIHLAEAKWNYDDSLTRHRLLPALPHILASRL